MKQTFSSFVKGKWKKAFNQIWEKRKLNFSFGNIYLLNYIPPFILDNFCLIYVYCFWFSLIFFVCVCLWFLCECVKIESMKKHKIKICNDSIIITNSLKSGMKFQLISANRKQNKAIQKTKQIFLDKRNKFVS